MPKIEKKTASHNITKAEKPSQKFKKAKNAKLKIFPLLMITANSNYLTF